jgi:hypothetical protein
VPSCSSLRVHRGGSTIAGRCRKKSIEGNILSMSTSPLDRKGLTPSATICPNPDSSVAPLAPSIGALLSWTLVLADLL